jgi:hypothetical protein
MISFEEAKQIAFREIGDDCALIETSTFEKPYGWYFCFQSKKYIEFRNPIDMLVGSGGFIVSKTNGRVFHFGSAHSLEENFEAYEAGFRDENWDLIVTRVWDAHQTAMLLHKLGMHFVKPETAHGVVWKIPQRYNQKQIKLILEKLPATFENQNFHFEYKLLEELKHSGCCEFEIRKHLE